MSSQGGCCGGSRKQADSTRGEAVRTQSSKDNDKLNQTGSSANKTVTVPASTESPAQKTHHGSCCE